MRRAATHIEFGDYSDIKVKEILSILDDCAQEILDLVEDGIELDEVPSTTKLFDCLKYIRG